MGPVQFTQIQTDLVALIKDALPSGTNVIWSSQQIPRELLSNDFVHLQMTQPPGNPLGRYRDETLYTDVPTSADLTLNSVTANVAYGFYINNIPYKTDAGAGDDPSDVIARLRSAVDASLQPVTASGGGSVVTLTPDEFGGLWGPLDQFPASAWSLSLNGPTPAKITMGHIEMVVAVNCYSRSRALAQGASNLCAKIRAAMQTFHSEAVIIKNIGIPNDLTALAGADFESRTQFSVTLQSLSTQAEAIDYIDSATVDVTGRNPDNTFSA